MDNIENTIREILHNRLACKLKLYKDYTYRTIVVPNTDTKIHIFPDSVCIPIPDYKVTISDLLLTLNDADSIVGVMKYFIFYDKDENFNNEVLGTKVVPFELNHLVLELFDLLNKLIECKNV